MSKETTNRSRDKVESRFLARRRDEALKTLSDIAKLLQSSKQEDNPLQSIVRLVRHAMKADVCNIYIIDDHHLVLVATDGLAKGSVGHVRMPLQKGLTGLVAETLEPVVVEEAREHPRFQYFPETKEERFASFAGVPLLERQQLVGVLSIQTKKRTLFDDAAVDMLSVISFQLASVIHNLITLEAVLRRRGRGRPKPSRSQGISAAPGFVIGPAFILRTQHGAPFAKKKNVDPKKEAVRLRKALEETSLDLITIEKKIRQKLSKKEADIFGAHRLILKDRHFRKKLNTEIQKKRSAEEAVSIVIQDYVQTFADLEDEYLRERVTDLEDLAQRIIGKLTGGGLSMDIQNMHGVLIAPRLTPSETALLDQDRIQGIVTVHGGHTGHAAILARSLGIPAVMGVAQETIEDIKPGELVIVDGNTGVIYVNPPKDVIQEYEKLQERYANSLVQMNPMAEQPALTKDGKRIYLEANVGLISSLQYLRLYGAEGVGLYRTEFPFMVRDSLPNEEQQYRVYKRIILAADGLPVTFRTLDAGGDKPISYLHLDGDESFLGYRSIRLCLAEPHILKTQLKALFRVAELGPIRILFPMISGIEEIVAVKKLIQEVKRDLRKRKVKIRIPEVPIGIMIEVPSAVQLSHLLIKEVDFFSIGTNDLIQYTLAVDRNNEKVAGFFEPFHPAVIHSLAQVIRAAHQANKWVSLCGEMAGDPVMTALLVGLGFDRLSMIPANIPIVKHQVQRLDSRKLAADLDKILTLPTAAAIKRKLARYEPKYL